MNRHRPSRKARALLATLSVVLAVGANGSAKPRHVKKAAPAPVAAPVTDTSAPPAPPSDAIPVKVVEVAGPQAYLEPGERGGVHRGTKVTIGQRQYTVSQATESFAAITIGENPPRVSDEGTATPSNESTTHVVVLAKPRPLSTWDHVWTEPVPPASTQTPRFVPLGGAERARNWDVRLSASSGALLPLDARGSNLVRAEIDARIHGRPFDAPADLDVDVALQRWFDPTLSARAGSSARPTLYVRELAGSYRSGGFYGALGRMRYAASTLGTLDGARASASLGDGFSVGAFGGLLPEPLSGAPSLVASRFGVEATYERPEAALRPSAALVVQGSTFQSKLDERRLSGVFGMYPGSSRLGGHFEVSSFDSTNPWNASAVELTAAGLDSSVRFGALTLEGRFDVRKPERSRWLAAYLPLTWFCTTAAAPAGAPALAERCTGPVSTAAYGALDAGVELGNVSIVVGGTRVFDLTQSSAPESLGAFVAGRVVRIARLLRANLSGTYSKATYADMFSGTVGPGLTLFGDALDVSLYYRATSLEYRSVSTSLREHAVGGAVMVIPDTTLVMAAQGEAVVGDDVKALMLLATATWHPRL